MFDADTFHWGSFRRIVQTVSIVVRQRLIAATMLGKQDRSRPYESWNFRQLALLGHG
jgi:hypothetical protein